MQKTDGVIFPFARGLAPKRAVDNVENRRRLSAADLLCLYITKLGLRPWTQTAGIPYAIVQPY